MNKYISLITNNRKKFIVLLVFLNITALIGLTKLNINAEFNIFKIENSQYQDSLDYMKKTFGGDDQTVLLVEAKADGLSNTINDIQSILEAYKISYTSPVKLLGLQGISSDNLVEDLNKLGNLSPVKIVDENAYITFMLNVDKQYDFSSLINEIESKGYNIYLSGDTYMQYEIIRLIFSVLIFLPPLALCLVLLTFRSQLSSFKAALLSVLPAGLAALWTLGLVGWIGGEVSILTVLAPIFAIVIGSADGLHFVSHMEEELVEKTPYDAITHTLRIVGMPMIITSTTSIAGFLGLLLIDTNAIKDLAIYASLGVFFAGIITWYVLPLIFTGDIHLKHKEKNHGNILIQKLWGKKSIFIAATLVILSLFFIPNIRTEFNQLMFFRDFTQVQKNFEKIVDVNDGAIPMYFIGEVKISDFKSRLIEINAVLKALESDEHVSKVINPLSLIPEDMSFSPTMMQNAKDFIAIKGDNIVYRFMIFPRDLNNNTIDAIIQAAEPYEAYGQLIGVQFLMKEMNQSMVKGQVQSIVFTFILIFIMLLWTLKSIRLALTASLPIVLTSIILYGFLGLTHISLNLMTCTIFSITLGIGVDYAIHYTSVYKYYYDLGDARPRETALKYSSRPVIANAFGLSIGLTALWISPLLIHLHISSLMWVSMTIAVFMSLTLLPTLLPKKTKITP